MKDKPALEEQAKPRKAETIRISGRGGGFEYAKVASRLSEAHEANTSLDVITTVEIIAEAKAVIVTATVKTQRGTYTGHSFGKIGSEEKALEKLETIAVGRALAFAGYSSSGDIASFEEMQSFDRHSFNAVGSSFGESMMKRIKGAQSTEDLFAIRKKINEMVDDEHLTPADASWLIDELESRRVDIKHGM